MRSREHPYGFHPKEKRNAAANALTRLTVYRAAMMLEAGMDIFLENPAGSIMWYVPEMQMLMGLQALSAEMVLELFYNVINKDGVKLIGYEAFEWCFKTRLQKRSTCHLCH